jgi:hypothetical protein
MNMSEQASQCARVGTKRAECNPRNSKSSDDQARKIDVDVDSETAGFASGFQGRPVVTERGIFGSTFLSFPSTRSRIGGRAVWGKNIAPALGGSASGFAPRALSPAGH